jgi:hypothetical protein
VFSLLFFKKTTVMAHGGRPHATVVRHGGCKAAACRRDYLATTVGHDVCPTTMGHSVWLSKLKNFENII